MKKLFKQLIDSNFLKFNFSLKIKQTIYNLWFHISFGLLFVSQMNSYLFLFSFIFLLVYFYILMRNTIEKSVLENIFPDNVLNTKFLIKISLIILIIGLFVFNVFFVFEFMVILLLNGFLYTFLPDKLKELEQQAKFHRDFENSNNMEYSKEFFIRTHATVLFEDKNIQIENLNAKTIKNQYKIMAKKYHPDVNSNHQNKFYEINNSYNELKNIFG